MKKTMIAATVGALAFISTPTLADSYAGFAIYDFYNSNISLTAGTTLNDKVSVHAQYIDISDFALRVTGHYALEDNFYALAGVSHYNGGTSETGAIIGAGYEFVVENIPIDVKASYDTALDGFFSVQGFARYQINPKFSVEGGYRVNTNGLKNEIGFGVRVAF